MRLTDENLTRKNKYIQMNSFIMDLKTFFLSRGLSSALSLSENWKEVSNLEKCQMLDD